jgi:pimeloyl-ACP methyl ester carboxylesterase
MSGRIAGPRGGWVVGRDYEMCTRINSKTKGTGFAVYSPSYEITSRWDPKQKRGVPAPWIKGVYSYATKKKHSFLHLIGFSGGGAVASSQLVDYPDKMVQGLVVISGPAAEGGPHTSAAFYANRINVRTLLTYGKLDGYNRAVDVWMQRARENKTHVDKLYYEGGHDYGQPKDSFELVTNTVIDWLKNVALSPRRTRHRRRTKHGHSRNR